jgi:hypothetical protein
MNEKIMKIHELLDEVDDILVSKFFDIDSENLLDEKINVLTQLKNGVPPKDIPEYYSILELYPGDDEMWD